mmetsp:Transcript_66238/g.149541  ORF Transcript_66238/g.149541 Transcript_66238/m.149541 type:complete len:222 (+) Transcript_66238:98-763(+)|eukprot:CAMPEP_0197904086 /NCGR_PEP_ID=MMETSP1439-20131203/57277_1 /TAXON_ID=66791 /ORGANISM="Gonyaulax spinifera, Strain CCMP409" /LENGTH=221 /DNA_ID=CAMNT_0043525249 /DNA_START=98 /DNA_END=763 /DNA_ORIENTATION=+
MAGSAPLFSDLRGVTVRNTFLEFEDVGKDYLPESGFTRQASEPAKPFNRQVSEQTTTGSGATLEESNGEPDDNYTQLASYLGCTLPQAFGADPRRGGGLMPEPSPASLQAVQGTFAVPRFCPNCGAETEPNHRFCPYCCYQLQHFPGGGGGGGGGGGAQQAAPVQQQSAVPINVEAGLNVNPSAPNLLAYLRRFRYVEACAADVELARVLCLNYMQTGKST